MDNFNAMPLVASAYGTECNHCSNATDRSNLKACGACKRAHYCNATCQKQDWTNKQGKVHRRVSFLKSYVCMYVGTLLRTILNDLPFSSSFYVTKIPFPFMTETNWSSETHLFLYDPSCTGRFNIDRTLAYTSIRAAKFMNIDDILYYKLRLLGKKKEKQISNIHN